MTRLQREIDPPQVAPQSGSNDDDDDANLGLLDRCNRRRVVLSLLLSYRRRSNQSCDLGTSLERVALLFFFFSSAKPRCFRRCDLGSPKGQRGNRKKNRLFFVVVASFFLREGVCNPQFQTVLGWPHTKKNRKFQFFKSLDVYQPISRSFQQHTHTKKKEKKTEKNGRSTTFA